MPEGTAEVTIHPEEFPIPESMRRRFGPITVQTVSGDGAQLNFDLATAP